MRPIPPDGALRALRRGLRSLGPAVGPGELREALRAGAGALIGLGLVGWLVLAPSVDLRTGLYLIAPFGASSVLLFAVPNSPLAQPWSAVVGNTVAGLVGVAVCLTVPDPALRIGLAVGLAISATILVRAVHPPAGAVAMTAAMSPEAIHHLGFGFALAPVALGTALLVAVAAVYARATGRQYPFRAFPAAAAPAAPPDPPPVERLGLTEAELAEILQRHRQSPNVGTEGFARLIGAAELAAAAHRAGPLTAAAIMSRDLDTVGPEAPLAEVADHFRRHGHTALPVVTEGDRFLGLIFQIQLIPRDGAAPRRAGQAMIAPPARAAADTPLAVLLALLSEAGCDAVPVLDGDRILGIVTRTDLLAALARRLLAEPAPAAG